MHSQVGAMSQRKPWCLSIRLPRRSPARLLAIVVAAWPPCRCTWSVLAPPPGSSSECRGCLAERTPLFVTYQFCCRCTLSVLAALLTNNSSAVLCTKRCASWLQHTQQCKRHTPAHHTCSQAYNPMQQQQQQQQLQAWPLGM